MGLRCRVVGEEGDVAVKIDKYFFSEGSEKEGEDVGIWGGQVGLCVDRGGGRGGKSSIEDRVGGACKEFRVPGGESG